MGSDMKKIHAAIVLGAGKGHRMGADIPKQFIEVNGKPILYYSLKAFQDSFIDKIVLVTGSDYIDYCRKDIVDANKLDKGVAIVEGGAERYDSVYEGLKALGDADYIYIHDGARPFVNEEILNRGRIKVEKCGAAIAGVPVKDTIKVVDSQGLISATPDRRTLWQVQTPQIFDGDLIREAYQRLMSCDDKDGVTDDAMVVEKMTDHKVYVYEASYNNIKITTPDDMAAAGKLGM